MTEAAKGSLDGAALKKGVDKLNSDGDRATFRLTPEAKVMGNIRGIKVGPKAQLGSTLSVTRNGDNDATATYTVRYDKHTLAAVAAEAGTDTLDKGGKQPGKSSAANLKAEEGVQTFDAVEMTFGSKAEAQRAAETVQRLQAADMGQDAVKLALGSTGPVSAPLLMADQTLSGGGANPAANPLTADGAPGRGTSALAGVKQADVDFLKTHVSAYEQTIGSRARLAAEVKGDLKLLDGALEGRGDANQRFTRRVEMPTDTKDGSVTYSVSEGLRLSAKERANRKLNSVAGGALTLKDDNRLELANATTTASLHYTIPKGTDPTASAGGRPVPEADALSGKSSMTLDKITIENRLQWRDQSLADPSRGDQNIVSERLTVDKPENLRPAANKLFQGDFEGAARASGAKLELRADDVKSTGTDTQPGVKLDLGVADLEATMIVTSGVDDVFARRKVTVQPGTPGTPETEGTPPSTRQVVPPAPGDDGKTYAVVPYSGVHARAEPDGESRGVIQSGSFMRDAGDRRQDAAGHDWMRVTGTDKNDAPVEGWVRSDMLAKHDAAKGAMDEQGRINPTNEYNRMDRITVQKDDNLWNLAKEHGWDFDQTLAANKDHINNPSLIFKGDTVYVPGSARGPKPVEQTVPGTPGTPGTDGTPSVQTQSQGQTDSPMPGTASGTQSGAPSGGTPGADKTPPAGPAPTAGPAAPAQAGAPTGNANDVAGRKSLDQIKADYQVGSDPSSRVWTPTLLRGVGGFLADGAAKVAGALGGDLQGKLDQLRKTPLRAGEADILDRLGPTGQLDWLKMTEDTQTDAKKAFDKPADYKGTDLQWGNDGHVDAYRHTLWNARMTQRYGEDWAREYATAHETVPGNPAVREAMDLHNNEVGRRIAVENPHASDAELQRLVKDAVDRGDTVVVDRNGQLAWSDRVAVGGHGQVGPGSAEGPANPQITVNPDRADPTRS